MSTRLDGSAIDLLLGSLSVKTRKAKINRTHRGDTTNALYSRLYQISPQSWPRWATRKVDSVQLTKDAMMSWLAI